MLTNDFDELSCHTLTMRVVKHSCQLGIGERDFSETREKQYANPQCEFRFFAGSGNHALSPACITSFSIYLSRAAMYETPLSSPAFKAVTPQK